MSFDPKSRKKVSPTTIGISISALQQMTAIIVLNKYASHLRQNGN